LQNFKSQVTLDPSLKGVKPYDRHELEKIRELREETGLTAGEILELGSFYTSNSLTDETATIFLARNLSPGKTDFDVTEKLTIKKVHISEAMEMIDEGLIRDSMSLIGLRWAVEYLKKLFHNLP
jgi:8-oxo-dGTP pyrophosphatase MutT (NUDIX family)